VSGDACVAPTKYILAQPITELELPEDVQMLVLGRLDQLDPRLRELTGRASVLGRSFRRGLLARVDELLGIDNSQLDADIAELQAQHIFAIEGGRIFFTHMLTQQAAYSALMQHNRRALHSAAASVLEGQLVPGSAAESDILPELATHLLKAGAPGEAHRRACQLLALKAHSGRFENWEQWETFARASWMSLRRDNIALADDSCALLTAQAARCAVRGQWDEARSYFEDALALAREARDTAVEAALLCSLGSLQRGSGEFAAAESSYLRALLLAREITQPQLEAAALRDLGTLQRERGLQDEALDYLLRALEASRACSDKRGEAVTLDNLGMLYMDRFMADAAQDAYQQALSIARELKSPWTEGLVLANLGLLHMKYMRFDAARASLDRASSLAREVGDPRLEGEVAGKRANLLLRLGETEAARPELYAAVALLEGVGNPFQLGFVHCQWTLLHLGQLAFDDARASLTRARHISRTLRLGQDSALEREIARCESALEQGSPVPGKPMASA
ncbi:MAG: tetratricopeptide repeat protein, partial [bacterium]|nr:tetratricopeptide repeat protein [bacterium]